MQSVADYAFYIIILLASYFIADYNIFLRLSVLDSLYGAFHFIRMYGSARLTHKEIVSRSYDLYSRGIIDRYILYAVVYVSYRMLCTFLWIPEIPLLGRLMGSVASPPLTNLVIESQLFRKIRKAKEEILKVLFAKAISSLIKLYSRVYLDREVDIQHREILPLFHQHEDIGAHIGNIARNMLFLLIMSQLKNYSSKLYYGIIKYVYNYKTGDMLISFNKESAKYCLLDIIDNRKWSELSKPNVYKAVVLLYQANDDNSDFLQELVVDFNITTLKTVTIWSIASFFESVVCVPILSFVLSVYRDGLFSRETLTSILFDVLGAWSGLLTGNYLLSSVVCQFGKKLVINRVTAMISGVVIDKTRKGMEQLIVYNSDIAMGLLCNMLYVGVINWIGCTPQVSFLIGINMFYNIVINPKQRRIVALALVLGSSSWSGFNMFHCVYNSIVFYMLLGHVGETQLIRLWVDMKKNIEQLGKWWFPKERVEYDDKFVFELMDRDKYPSVSDKMQSQWRFIDLDPQPEINAQEVLERVNDLDTVFSQTMSHHGFIEAISVQASMDTYEIIVSSDECTVDENYLDKDIEDDH